MDAPESKKGGKIIGGTDRFPLIADLLAPAQAGRRAGTSMLRAGSRIFARIKSGPSSGMTRIGVARHPRLQSPIRAPIPDNRRRALRAGSWGRPALRGMSAETNPCRHPSPAVGPLNSHRNL